MCRNCIKSVLQKSHLSTHTHNRHGEIKHCGICGKSFTNILHLKEHMVSHTNAKPFSCGIGERTLECKQPVTDHMSLVMRKPAFCICENKDADQLRSNCAPDQRLCFRYMNSTIILLSKSEISSL